MERATNMTRRQTHDHRTARAREHEIAELRKKWTAAGWPKDVQDRAIRDMQAQRDDVVLLKMPSTIRRPKNRL